MSLFSIGHIETLLITYRYIIALPLYVIEGPIAMIVSGFVVYLGYLNFYIIYTLAVGGDLIGDMIYYYIGKYGKKKLLNKYLRKWNIADDKFAILESHFERHTGKTLLLGKAAHGVGGPILAAAGAAEVPIRKFLFYNIIATIPKSLLLIFIGMYLGKNYAAANSYLGYISLISTTALIIFVVFYLHRKLTAAELKP